MGDSLCEGGLMAGRSLPLVANVTEAGDIVLLAILLVITLAVGLVLLGIDTLVARLGARRPKVAPPPK